MGGHKHHKGKNGAMQGQEKNLQLCLKRRKHKNTMKSKAENRRSVGILSGIGYRIKAQIYPLVTNPMIRVQRS